MGVFIYPLYSNYFMERRKLMVSPNTIVHLLSVDIEEDQKNQMDFASATAQYNYFTATDRVIKSYTSSDFTYQRKDNIIRIPAEYDDLIKVNYVMYQNTNYSTKWFYAFVTKKEYVNANMTALYLKTDVFQTWQFEMELDYSFVAREHVANDGIFVNTLPEPTPSVEYTNDLTHYTSGGTSHDVKVLYNGSNSVAFTLNYYRGVFSCPPATFAQSQYPIVPSTPILQFVGGVPASGYLYISDDGEHFNDLIERLTTHNYNIVFTTAIPKSALYDVVTAEEASVVIPHVWVAKDLSENSSYSGNEYVAGIDTTKIGNYTIKNNKLNCYPYRYRTLTDLVSQNIVFKNELLGSTTFCEHWTGGSTPTLSVYPKKYAGVSNDYSKSVNISAFPPVPYNIDTYQQYLALHKNTLEVGDIAQNVDSTFKMIHGIMDTGSTLKSLLSENRIENLGGAVGSAVSAAENFSSAILGDMQRNAMYADLKAAPPDVHGNMKSNTTLTNNAIGWAVYDTHITEEYAKIIDQYFELFGYNVSTIKKPQFTSRQKWNYLETVNVNISAKTNTNIPQDDMQELKQIFNNGITIWHGNSASTSNWCNYNQSNPIVQNP